MLFPAAYTFDQADQGRNWTGDCNKGLQSPIDIPQSHLMKSSNVDPRSSLRFDYKRAAATKSCKWAIDYDNTVSSKLNLKLAGCAPEDASQLYYHLPYKQDESLKYQLQGIQFKTPSEHTINGHHYLAEMQFIHTLVIEGSLISADTKKKIDSGVQHTLGFSIMFKIGNRNKWIHDLYVAAKAANFGMVAGDFTFDHTLFVQEGTPGFWYDTNNWNYAFYIGSNTIPPCNQYMVWLVCVHPVDMSMEQSMGLQKMFRLKPSRALQFFNNRLVKVGKYVQSNMLAVGGQRVPNMSASQAYPAWTPSYHQQNSFIDAAVAAAAAAAPPA